MKTKWIVFGLIAALCLSLSTAVLATPVAPFFVDETELVSSDVIDALNQRAEEIAATYDCGLSIWLVEEAGEDAIYDDAESAFYDNAYGYGPSESGMILMISVYTGDYIVIPFGDAADLFWGDAFYYLENAFADPYMADDYLGAFNAYYDLCEMYLAGVYVSETYETEMYEPEVYGINVPGLTAGVKPALVTDQAGLLTSSEVAALNKKAHAISDAYGVDVAVITVANMGGGSAFVNAMDIYDQYAYGYGAERSGILLMLSDADRDFAFVCHGYANIAFTDYGQKKIENAFLPYLRQDNYNGAFNAFLEKCETTLILMAVCAGIALLVAFCICSAWKRQMKTAVKQSSANAYIPAGGFVLTGQSDMFLFRTETRRKIETSSSGGGGTSTNSRGFSGRSGKY